MANNQNVNKVQYGSQVLIDLTSDTVTADKLLSGYTAHDASGAQITGTATGGVCSVTQDANGYLVLDDDPPSSGGYQQKTVAPSAETQIIEADEYIVNTSFSDMEHTASSSTGYWPITWYEALEVGKTYRIVLSGTRLHYNRTYEYDQEVTWAGFPFTFTPTITAGGGHGTETFTIETDRITHQISTSEEGYFKLSLTITDMSVRYVALSRVTVLGTSGTSNPIRFFDYDGTLVASYSSVPSSLPPVPTHTGLTNGTWNYTLAQITTQFNAMGTCDVGANYDTVSGATEIDIVLQDGRLHPYLSLAVNGTVIVDWGDNSTSTATGTSLTTRLADIHHEYATAGKYTIKITKTSGTGYSLYCTSLYSLLNKNDSTANANRVYSNCVQSVRVGEDCAISDNAFYGCHSLASVSIPSGVTSIGNNAFYYCYSLASVSIPSGVTSIGSSAFQYCYALASVSIPSGVTSVGSNAFSGCYSLASVSIPSGVTSISNSAFYGCYSLASVSIPSGVTSIGSNVFQYCYSLASVSIPSGVTSFGNNALHSCYSLVSVSIPSGVTSIGSNAFYYCYGMAEYHFEPTTPPTLTSTNAFTNIQGDCVMYVPYSADHSVLEAYQTANNWSTYASYMQEEPQ